MSVDGSTVLRIFAAVYCFGKPVKIHHTWCVHQITAYIGSISGTLNDQSRFTNGFPSVLDLHPAGRNNNMTNMNSTLRLIPEMSFTCNGSIVGFTVAGRPRRQREQDPMVHIWRQSSSQNVYYRTNISFAVNDAVCPEISTESNDDRRVWQCNLNVTNQVPVQAGDILGILLPPRSNASFQMAFATVSRGPTNYVFEKPEEVVDVNLSDVTWTSSVNQLQELPQISVQVESGTHVQLLDFHHTTNYLCKNSEIISL